jgi:hypothetical protein
MLIGPFQQEASLQSEILLSHERRLCGSLFGADFSLVAHFVHRVTIKNLDKKKSFFKKVERRDRGRETWRTQPRKMHYAHAFGTACQVHALSKSLKSAQCLFSSLLSFFSLLLHLLPLSLFSFHSLFFFKFSQKLCPIIEAVWY